MAEFSIEEPNKDRIDNKWRPESLSDMRLSALLPYTELASVEEFKATLATLSGILGLLSVREGRNKFLARSGGPTKTEYVLYAGGKILGGDFAKLEDCLDTLGINMQPVDALDREIVVVEERGKTTLELLGLVAGQDPDIDLRGHGENWNAIATAAMERAATEDASDDMPAVHRSYRSFPLRGSSRQQEVHAELRRHFAEGFRGAAPEGDPVELDLLIDDTATRLDEGRLTLEQAFREWGLEVDESVEDSRQIIPADKPLGEMLSPKSNSKYRWQRGMLYRRDKDGASDGSMISPEMRRDIYAKAQPAAELLWDADMLERKADRTLSSDEPWREKAAARLRMEATEKRKLADTMPDSIKAIGDAIEIHQGFVFTRVMRFLKRRDVRTASAFGPKDLMQEGTLGVYRALAGFDSDESGSFIGYARYNIDSMMMSYALRHRTFMTLPTNIQTTLNQLYDIDTKADAVPEDAAGRYSMSPDARRGRRLELFRRIFGDRYDLGKYLDRKRRETHQDVASYAIPISDLDENDPSVVDMHGDDVRVMPEMKAIDAIDTKKYLSQLLVQALTPREERVIRLRFGIGALNGSREEKTLEEVAEHVGGVSGEQVSSGRVGQIEAKALRKLKGALWRRFGQRDEKGDKYIDMEIISRVFATKSSE